jgi:hypothetical protein
MSQNYLMSLGLRAPKLRATLQRSKLMTHQEQATIDYSTIDLAAIDAHARQLRAEAFAEFGSQISNWFTSLNFGFAARTAH